ncbi:MAG TPA: hypothetical protein VLA61_00505 [Ideonella sp.]|uniref:hypothetical protein n=1 Tax=Ideonella sp. TaxID=1929293 RepID=UPI002B6DF10D|nr:hypothetical protein [Ideonella sp.]HSI46730.1 hypothetical protein [Ideonella sp.]
MNKTVEALCGEIGAAPLQIADEPNVRQEWLFVPACFQLPETAPLCQQPGRGASVAAGAAFYSDRRGGYVQVVQQPLTADVDAGFGYGLIVQVAEFDGDWLSLVFDAQPLIAQSRAGKARLLLSAHAQTEPAMPVKLRCSLTVDGQVQNRDFELHANANMSFEADLGHWVPADVSMLAFHVIFTPAARSILSLRRLSAVLVVDETAMAVPVASSDSDGIFEVAP